MGKTKKIDAPATLVCRETLLVDLHVSGGSHSPGSLPKTETHRSNKECFTSVRISRVGSKNPSRCCLNSMHHSTESKGHLLCDLAALTALRTLKYLMGWERRCIWVSSLTAHSHRDLHFSLHACSFQVHAAGLKKMSRGREGSGWEWTASVRPLTPHQLCKGQINSSDPRIPSLSAINKDAPAVTCLLASCFFESCVSDLWCNMSLQLFWKRLMGHLWHISTWVKVHHQHYGVEYGRFYVHW